MVHSADTTKLSTEKIGLIPQCCGWCFGCCVAVPEKDRGCQLSSPLHWASLGACGRRQET